jgi:hypothetical protein
MEETCTAGFHARYAVTRRVNNIDSSMPCHVPNSTTITQRLVHTPITRELLLTLLLLQHYLSISPMRKQRLRFSVKDLACRLANCLLYGSSRARTVIAQGKSEASRRSHTPIPLEACLPIVPSTSCSCPMEILQAIATGLECRICWQDD